MEMLGKDKIIDLIGRCSFMQDGLDEEDVDEDAVDQAEEEDSLDT